MSVSFGRPRALLRNSRLRRFSVSSILMFLRPSADALAGSAVNSPLMRDQSDLPILASAASSLSLSRSAQNSIALTTGVFSVS